jgi:enamidase
MALALSAGAQTKRIKPPAEHLIFKCKALINPATGTTLENAFIETNGGRILRIGKAAELTASEGAKVVDYGDKYVIPGLIDTHGHLYGGITVRYTTSPLFPIFFMAAGVTSIGDPGSMDPGGDLAMRNRIDSGLYTGPRYFLAGEYLEMAPVTVGWMNPLATPEEARLKVDRWAAEGISAIKIYANMSGDVMQAAIDEAHEHGLRVWAHIGAVTYKQAMAMGVDQLFHGALAMPDTRPPGITQKNFSAWADSTGTLDLSNPEILDVLRQAAAHKVVLTPTVVVLDALLPGTMELHHMEEQKKYYAPQAWDKLVEYSHQFPGFKEEQVRSNVAKNIEFVRRAHDAGCILSTGTDLVVPAILPGFSLWREMELFSAGGLSPMEVLKAATVNGAYALGRSDQLGTVEAGKLADFVVLSRNPLEDINNVRSVSRVVKGGVIYDPQELLKPLEGKVY